MRLFLSEKEGDMCHGQHAAFPSFGPRTQRGRQHSYSLTMIKNFAPTHSVYCHYSDSDFDSFRSHVLGVHIHAPYPENCTQKKEDSYKYAIQTYIKYQS